MKKSYSIFLVIFLTLSAIILLNTVSPAVRALDLSVLGEDSVIKGSLMSFAARVNVSSGETFNLSKVDFSVENPAKHFACTFYPNGTVISGGNNLSLDVLETPQTGYTNGSYTNGSFKFNVTISTSELDSGIYKAVFVFNASSEFTKEKVFVVTSETNEEIKSCSIRAGEGTLKYEDKVNTNNKLNMNIPLSGASKAQGGITSQGKERISFEFTDMEILNNNNNIMLIKLTGSLKRGLNAEYNETAFMQYDKTSGKVKIVSTSGLSFMSEMTTSFVSWC